MKVTNDLIDMVTEACLDISTQTDRSYDDCMGGFLKAYLGAEPTKEGLIEATTTRTHEEWKAAYERFDADHFRNSPYRRPS